MAKKKAAMKKTVARKKIATEIKPPETKWEDREGEWLEQLAEVYDKDLAIRKWASVRSEFQSKLRNDLPIVGHELELSIQTGGMAKVSFNGNTSHVKVVGNVAIVGTVWYKDGRSQKFYQELIGPFWRNRAVLRKAPGPYKLTCRQ